VAQTKKMKKHFGPKRGGKPGFSKRNSSDKKDKPFRKSFDNKEGGERKFGDKPFRKRDEGQGTGGKGDFKPFKKSFGNKEGGERKFGDKPFRKRDEGQGTSGRGDFKKDKPFGDKPYKKSFGNKEGGERRFDDKPFRKSFGNKEGGERKFGDKPDYAKKTSSDRPYKKSFGNKEGGEKRFGDKPFRRKDEGSDFSKRNFSDRKKNFGDKPDYAKRASSDKREEKSEEKNSDWTVFKNADEAQEFIKSNRNEKKSSGKSSEHFPREFKNENRPLKVSNFSGDDSSIRLNRFIANTGICSRREADDLITAGVIKVNGKIVTELGTKIAPSDTIHYGDQLLRREKMAYVLLNKPKDYITTTDDPRERKTVMHLIESAGKERVYPVGRLDRNTTGLLLFTNDGDLAERLTHPKYGIRKIYHVSLDKNLRTEDFDKIMAGVEMEDGYMKADELSFVGDGLDKKEVGIVIHSGRNRIVRRLFETLGYDVVKLDRVVYAGLTKKNLPRASFRHLTPEEVGMLRMLVGGEKKVDSKRFDVRRSKGKRNRK
jgi:23S rRNA pseudouridine2605 synthase